MSLISCIKDSPIKQGGDRLKAGVFAEALCKFIRHADTPVTIGIQGGWGSGKTSLFTLIQSKLEDEYKDAILYININAWEHSLFQEKQGQSQVVLSILAGITDSIQKEIDQKPNLDKSGRSFIQEKIAPALKKSMHLLGQYLPSAIGAAVGAYTGANATFSRDCKEESATEPIPKLADQVRELRKNIETLVANIKKDNHGYKTIIFIDDLDRVAPATAVDILDVIKNIFDIENCIFILAIDYEVVVKGLESKFGKRNSENEREFRQYFDKIIQVPFSMPVGAYSNEMKNLIRDAFTSLEIYQDYQLEDSTLETLAHVSKLATGGNPRSIKRMLNTLSLLQYIPYEEERNLSPRQREAYLQARFIIVALHLNFPEISRRIMENNKFTSWNLQELDASWGLDYKANKDDLDALFNNADMRLYFDEDWEKIIFCLCAKTEWLKRKAWSISRLLNKLRFILNQLECDAGHEEQRDELDQAPLSDAAMDGLSHILSTINVVSIDSEQTNPNERLKYDPVSRHMKQIHTELLKRLPQGLLADPDDSIYAEQSQSSYSRRVYKIPCADKAISQLALEYDEDEKEFTANILGSHARDISAARFYSLFKELTSGIPEPWDAVPIFSPSADNQIFRAQFNVESDAASLENASGLADSIASFYTLTDELAQKIN